MSSQMTMPSWLRSWDRFRRGLPKIDAVFKGHPLHALSTDLPASLIPTGFVFSVWGRLARNKDIEKAGFLTTAAGLVGAIPTALFGLADYLQMDVDDPAQITGITHGVLNATALGLGIASLGGRSLKQPGSRRGLWLGGLSTFVLFLSAYLGGDLVFHRGWRVKPIEREESRERPVAPTVHEDDFVLRNPRAVSMSSAQQRLPIR